MFWSKLIGDITYQNQLDSAKVMLRNLEFYSSYIRKEKRLKISCLGFHFKKLLKKKKNRNSHLKTGRNTHNNKHRVKQERKRKFCYMQN